MNSLPTPPVVVRRGKYRFYPLGNTTSTLEPLDASNQLAQDFWILGTGVQDLRADDPVSDPFVGNFDTSRFRLTTKDGSVFILDEALGLLELRDLNGNTLVLNRDGQNRVSTLVSTQNAPGGPITTSIAIHRDSTGRVDYIRDPAGKDLDYTYDTTGRLASFTNRELSVTQFRYENPNFPYHLTKIIDPLGRPALRTEYGDDGRVTKQIDADGNETLFDRGIDGTNGRFERVKDRLNQSSTFFYDTLGNVTLKIDPLGAKTSFKYYPDSDRTMYEIDHYGNVKSMAYDARANLVAETMGASQSEDPTSPTSGYTTRTSYDAHNNPTSMTDAEGRITTFSYDAVTHALLAHTVGANLSNPSVGLTTSYTYTADGQISTTTDALGNVTSYTTQYGYSDPGHPTAIKQQTVTVNDRDRGVLRVTRSLFDAGQNQIAQIATRTLPDGTTQNVVTRYRHDSENRVRATIHPDGRVTEVRYLATGQQDCTLEWRTVAEFEAASDATARITKYGYDARGNGIKTTYPDSTSDEASFDAENRRIWSQDRLGRRTFFVYDAVGRLRFTISPNANDGLGAAAPTAATDSRLADNARSETVYDLIGRVTKQIDERGTVTELTYYPDGTPDAMRRKEVHQRGTASLTDLVTSYEYNKAGAVRFVTDPRGAKTETRYDEFGRVRYVIYPATDEHPATQTETRYDALGRRSEVIDTEQRSTKFAYDGLGRLLSVTDALNQATSYTYDESGNQLTQTDANGHTTTYWTDNLGRRTKRILPKGSSEATALYEQLDYDEWGNLWHRRDFAGHKTTFTYDSIHRLKSQVADPAHPSLIYSHAVARVEYDYDANSARTAARTFNANNLPLYVEATPHTERGWLDYKDTPHGRLDYDYYENGLLKDTVSSNVSGVNLGYRYDELNRLEHVDDGTSGTVKTTAYSYNANGSLATVLTPNGIKHSYTFDALNRLRGLTIANTIAATAVRTYDYQHYASGHRRKIVESNGRTADYSYDAIYRLKQELITGDPAGKNGVIGYDLDPVGNRKSRTSTLPEVGSQFGLTYNARDWADSDTYDSNGNTQVGRTALAEPPGTDTYDFQNRLILRRKSNGSSINLAYDADGNRIQKTNLSAVSATVSSTTYLVDTNNLTGYAQVVEERTAVTAGTTLKVYAYGSDLLSQTKTPIAGATVTSYYAYDGLASIRFLISGAGTITDTYDYDAFGNQVARAGTTENAYLYRGEQFDQDLGLYYNRARYLNQNTGRFWSMDSYEGQNDDPISLHKYLYANANPVRFVDPSGQFSMLEIQHAMFVVSTLGRMAIPTIARVGVSAAQRLAASALQPFFVFVGTLPIVTQAGQRLSSFDRFLRFFVTPTQSYPGVSNWLAELFRTMGATAQQHHVFIQQAWYRAGSPNQWYAANEAANRGMQRLGNAGFNLLAIPEGLNNALGRSAAGTAAFATATAGSIGLAVEEIWDLITGPDEEEMPRP